VERITVLLAEDHAVVREGLRALLEAEDAFRVVGETRTGREAERLTKTLLPDLVAMDIAMPLLNGRGPDPFLPPSGPKTPRESDAVGWPGEGHLPPGRAPGPGGRASLATRFVGCSAMTVVPPLVWHLNHDRSGRKDHRHRSTLRGTTPGLLDAWLREMLIAH